MTDEEKPTCYEILLQARHDLSKYGENIINQLKMSHAPLEACELFLALLEKWCAMGG